MDIDQDRALEIMDDYMSGDFALNIARKNGLKMCAVMEIVRDREIQQAYQKAKRETVHKLLLRQPEPQEETSECPYSHCRWINGPGGNCRWPSCFKRKIDGGNEE